jgi:DNA-binding Lrp family transcriptional regulator
VSESPLRLDALDLDIYRELYRGSTRAPGGVDPRLNATRIAHRLKVGRARVAGRLRSWSRSGFLVRYDVWPNPALFGARTAWLNIQVDHPRHKPALFERLGMLEGAIWGLEFLGDWITLGVVGADGTAFERARGLVRGLAGVAEVETPMLSREVEPSRALTPLDVRIVRALRERPTATLSATAQRVGVSTRTITRRYSELIDRSLVWFVPVLDFRAISYPVVAVTVEMRPGAPSDGLARRIRARYPLAFDYGDTDPDAGGPGSTGFIVIPPSAAHLEELDRYIAGLDGVVRHETNVFVRMHSFPGWFDRQLRSGTERRA